MEGPFEQVPYRPPAAVREMEDYTRAILNILEDSLEEKADLQDTKRAIVNILEDFSAEKTRLEDVQRAVLNILEGLFLGKVAPGRNPARHSQHPRRFRSGAVAGAGGEPGQIGIPGQHEP